MKKISGFLSFPGGILGMIFIVVAAMTMIISCSKTPPSPPPPPPPVPTLTLTASASPGSALPNTVWYSGTSTISWSTTNATSVSLVGGNISDTSGSFTTPALTSPITYTFTATGSGGSVTKQITVYVWSQKMTLLCNYGSWKENYFVAFNITDSLNPTVFGYPTLDCSTYLYQTNNKALVTLGTCWPNPGTVGKLDWSWQNNETAILYSFSDLWNVDSLSSTGFRRWQDKPDPFNPSLKYRTIQKFIHP